MANPEHLKILEQGIEVWNAWRKSNDKEVVDLSQADLRGKDLTGAWLWKANLTAFVERPAGGLWRPGGALARLQGSSRNA